MKKYLILIITGFLVLNISCTKWLEENQFDKINSDIIYTSPEGLKTAIGGLYSLNRRYYRFTDLPNTRANYWFYCAADLSVTRTYNEANIYHEGMIPAGFYEDMWINGYQLIDRASAIIVNARKVDMPLTDKNSILAQAQAVRAMAYLRLVTIYDNILLDTIPTTKTNAFDPVEFKPATKDQIFNLINTDLDFAIANLPYITDPGLFGKGMARHLRAEAAMWMEDWATAAANCDSLISSGTYSLVPIDQIFGAKLDHTETMFLWQFDELLGGQDSLAGGSGSPLGAAFQSRFYEIKLKGESVPPVIEDNLWGGNAFGWNLPNDYLRSLYEVGKDQRLKYFFYPDTIIGNNPKSKYFGKPLPGPLPYSTMIREYHWSIMKYRDFTKPASNNLSYKDIIAYRLAETYILGAEAHWRMGGNSDPKALEYLNAVRTRAGVENVKTIDLDVIMDEQARELCFEGKRWFFLKRIGRLVSQFNLYHRQGASTTDQFAYNMEEFHVRWPIPQSQIDVMVTFPQNPGY